MNLRSTHYAVFLLAAILAVSGCLQGTPSPGVTQSHPYSTSHISPACSGVLWRYILKDAIPCMLSDEELSKIEPLAVQLKGKDIEESIWNILRWEEEHITYDRQKVKLVVYSNGTVKIPGETNSTIQTPYETVRRGKGICTDYAILTAGLLLAMNYSPVYIFEINMTGPGHAAAAYKISGWFFILDQHLPPMNLGAYYLHWNGSIKNATVYEIRKENGTAEVKTAGILDGADFLVQSYSIGENDLEAIRKGIAGLLLKNFENLALDSSLQSLKEGKLPQGYREGGAWTYTFPDYYHPLFYRQFVRYLYERIISDPEIKASLKAGSAFWLSAEKDEGAIKLTLCTASR